MRSISETHYPENQDKKAIFLLAKGSGLSQETLSYQARVLISKTKLPFQEKLGPGKFSAHYFLCPILEGEGMEAPLAIMMSFKR